MRARLNDDGRRIQEFHRLHLKVARSLRSLANKVDLHYLIKAAGLVLDTVIISKMKKKKVLKYW